MNALNWVGTGDGNGHTVVTPVAAPRSSQFDHLFVAPPFVMPNLSPLVIPTFAPLPPMPPPAPVLMLLAQATAFDFTTPHAPVLIYGQPDALVP